MLNSTTVIRTTESDYRLIWFQHFHKAAGTYIVNMARENNETFYPNHINGHPIDDDGNIIPLWTFIGTELTAFVDCCQKRKVTFVSTEWGLPELEYLVKDARVILITCLRDPLERFISNYYFDLHHDFTTVKSIDSYSGYKNRTFTLPNYYCRILSRVYNQQIEIGEKQFRQAEQNLELFDVVVRLGESLQLLAKYTGWNTTTRKKNINDTSFRNVVALIRYCKFRLLLKRLLLRKKMPDSQYISEFRKSNYWDYQLMEYARHVAGRSHTP